MDNILETSPYMEWYVTSDPGVIFIASGVITGASILWFKPKYGFDSGNEICIASGNSDELTEFKAKIDKRRNLIKSTDRHAKYLEIEKVFEAKDDWAKAEALKPHMSEWQKDRLVRLRKK